MKASDSRPFRRRDLRVTALGMGSAPFGGLYGPVKASDAVATVEASWEAGIRYFDTAPMYGSGRSEHLLGQVLREREGPFAISTKVGRLMANKRPGRELPPPAPKGRLDNGWSSKLPFQEVFDYSYDAVMRSYDDSQQRTGLAHFDILYVHDIGRLTHQGEAHERHWSALTKGGGFRALAELRDAGCIKAFGLGVNEWEVIRDAMEEADIDCCLLAGRYTLLDQQAAKTFLPLARSRGVEVILGGVFNSGVLAGKDRKFNYADAPPEILEKVKKLEAVCARHDVPLPAAAMQFPYRNPAITSILIGAVDAAQIRQNVAWFERDIPESLWKDLASAGLIGE